MIDISDPDNYFLTWSTQYNHEDMMYYVRLDMMEVGTCKTIWQLDYGRFKESKEASEFIETLPDPYEAAIKEAKVFAPCFRS